MRKDDRIKLAVAMGYPGDHYTLRHNDGPPSFDPFTSARDDYAVLEWMRDQDSMQNAQSWRDFKNALIDTHAKKFSPWTDADSCHSWNYTVGDYARAALTVLQQRTPDA